ncbi:MAG: ferredoxin [Rhizobacter sp.]|nr:ferredoxin [Rhizobacter sp.]
MTGASAMLSVRVAARKVEALDIASFELVEAQGKPLPSFSAGSHVDVELPGGLVRQYSLCNDPSEGHRYQIAVLRDPASRGGSRAMHEVLKIGDVIQISVPKNHFELAHAAGKHLLMAGGIGVTPVLCMAERLAVMGADFEMHYAARSRERTAFIDRISASPFASKVVFHFDDGAAEQKLNIAQVLSTATADTHLYVCGPKGYMDAVLSTARSAGWPEERLHFEFFGAEVEKSATDESFQVKMASSGKVVTVGKDQTITEALAAAGIEVLTSCEQGVCGTCLTRVLEGIPDHKDMYLTPAEQAANDQFLPCCSRSKSPMLVLDI